ncbi:site-2 protease family protein [Slackia heliotrinireducens]|jgi:Zn-dependent protease|uniref:Zn-dependent protease n=1 Tax=Slackia heliotrinireducens (strain ATCC 29202 / DSM 20476 / NCTC 11029 / RHS 1) TaxID=471855 RepID=C7N514_SLAHD|nr:site-2 protease family protein [Slackia heliotrinireducens]ACV21999.1 Zn-dependent protease [Slackia heliotrinireducens DSM 20476]VEG99898.1 Zn-dependent proteases [Slackia heliotrinireducens]
MDELIYIIIQVLCFVPAIVFHEVSHGFAAMKLGDPTAKSRGRLSLNPLKHIDPFGTVLMPLMLMAMNMPIFGYAKPVPYNPRYFRDIRKGEAIVGVAGPAANLAMALLASAVAWLLWPAAQNLVNTSEVFVWFYLVFIPMFVLINLYLMFFNLIPIPPLDGASIIALFLPAKALPTYYRIQQYAMPVFMVVVILLPYLTNINLFGMYLNATAGNLANLLLPFNV